MCRLRAHKVQKRSRRLPLGVIIVCIIRKLLPVHMQVVDAQLGVIAGGRLEVVGRLEELQELFVDERAAMQCQRPAWAELQRGVEVVQRGSDPPQHEQKTASLQKGLRGLRRHLQRGAEGSDGRPVLAAPCERQPKQLVRISHHERLGFECSRLQCRPHVVHRALPLLRAVRRRATQQQHHAVARTVVQRVRVLCVRLRQPVLLVEALSVQPVHVGEEVRRLLRVGLARGRLHRARERLLQLDERLVAPVQRAERRRPVQPQVGRRFLLPPRPAGQRRLEVGQRLRRLVELTVHLPTREVVQRAAALAS
mmetsp:Transcript_616/g.1083  ORF Transcript_616/g.1083 Transcript_616/m.1083 type:complete len:309 (-) Transcript_616:257-1183(-)